MTAQCREDNDTPERTTGTVSALELATRGVRRAEGLCSDFLAEKISRTAALELWLGFTVSVDLCIRRMHQIVSEADLGMFSMFGRTGAPTKRGPPQQDR